jgi:hypothetical protein
MTQITFKMTTLLGLAGDWLNWSAVFFLLAAGISPCSIPAHYSVMMSTIIPASSRVPLPISHMYPLGEHHRHSRKAPSPVHTECNCSVNPTPSSAQNGALLAIVRHNNPIVTNDSVINHSRNFSFFYEPSSRRSPSKCVYVHRSPPRG